MPVEARERRRLLHERRLLRNVVALARRCPGPLPLPLLDAVLRHRRPVRPLLPGDCSRPSP